MAKKSVWVYITEFLFSKEKQSDERDLLIKYKATAASYKITMVSFIFLIAYYNRRHADINWYMVIVILTMVFTQIIALIYYRRKL